MNNNKRRKKCVYETCKVKHLCFFLFISFCSNSISLWMVIVVVTCTNFTFNFFFFFWIDAISKYFTSVTNCLFSRLCVSAVVFLYCACKRMTYGCRHTHTENIFLAKYFFYCFLKVSQTIVNSPKEDAKTLSAKHPSSWSNMNISNRLSMLLECVVQAQIKIS